MESDKRYTIKKRDLIRFGGAALATAAIAGTGVGYWIGSSQPKDTQTSTLPVADKTAEPILGIPPFEDVQANEIARQKGINVENFFNFSSEVLDNISAFLGETLYPIYPPTVLDHKQLIYDLAKEFLIPPNIIATIMTIESCGLYGSESPQDAQGLFQVLPLHFDVSIQKNPDAMQEPYLNGRKGMDYFVNTCLPAARSGFPSGYGKNHVNIYARAMMAYNAGKYGATANFANLPDETKFYSDHFIRFAMSAEIADGLRSKGRTDPEIIQKLSSTEMDARAWALQVFDGNAKENKGGYSYTEYTAVLKEIVLEVPGVDKKTQKFTENGEGFNRDYKNFLSDPKSKYAVRASPGLRIWLALGGRGLFLKDQRNLDTTEWDKIQSRP